MGVIQGPFIKIYLQVKSGQWDRIEQVEAINVDNAKGGFIPFSNSQTDLPVCTDRLYFTYNPINEKVTAHMKGALFYFPTSHCMFSTKYYAV